MNKVQSIISAMAVPLTLLPIGLFLFTGCGERTAKLTPDQSMAFDTAPAEVKQAWEKALAADKANDYVPAQNSLDSLKPMYLSDPQRKALEIETTAFGRRLTHAFEQKEPAAVNAIQIINHPPSQRN